MNPRRPSSFGLLLALLALIAQLGFSLGAPQSAAAEALIQAATICHGDTGADSGQLPAPAHHNDCVLCPLCVSASSTVALLSPAAPALPAPATLVIARAAIPPPATAPPASPRFAAQPRAPPAQT
jgi:NAD-dependent dihydropyrimidine dehydrogenase PreA subunit